MSSKKTKNLENKDFVARLVEACGSSQPAQIAQLLNISYQAAKNYLAGRLPETKTLKIIAEKTSCSIDWLLTGRGEKYLQPAVPAFSADTLLVSDQMRAFVRQICLEVVSEMLSAPGEPAQPKVVTLTSDKIKEEKIIVPPPVISGNSGQ